MQPFLQKRRDPKRFLPLIHALLDVKFNPESRSLFSEGKKFLFARSVHVLGWRAYPYVVDSIQQIVGFVRHPYNVVREIMASCLSKLVHLRRHLSFSSADAAVQYYYNHRADLHSLQIERDEFLVSTIISIFQGLAARRTETAEINYADAPGTSDYAHGSKTSKFSDFFCFYECFLTLSDLFAD